MTKRSYIFAAIFALACATIFWFVVSRSAIFREGLKPGDVVSSGVLAEPQKEVPYVVEEVVRGLEVPWGIAFTSSERLLVTERPGRLRVIEKGKLDPVPLRVFPEVASRGEAGLMSIALHPDYAQNKELYLVLTYEKNGKLVNKIVRFRDEGDTLTHETVILDDIPGAEFHAGSRIAFGPDGRLYATTGDATDKTSPQNVGSLGGKVLRVNPDGSIPPNNPFPKSPVWSFGHRNAQGLAWHPQTRELYITEHGPSIFDGPAGGDEVNHIVRGSNYGWPVVSHEEKRSGMVAPILLFTPAEAPASAMFYTSDVLPQFKNDLFFGALAGKGLVRVRIDNKDPDKVVAYEKLSAVRFGRIRDVTEGPDGFIYFSTSNRDGRGDPASADDRIFRIRPVLPN